MTGFDNRHKTYIAATAPDDGCQIFPGPQSTANLYFALLNRDFVDKYGISSNFNIFLFFIISCF